jgi:hypothetical protein
MSAVSKLVAKTVFGDEYEHTKNTDSWEQAVTNWVSSAEITFALKDHVGRLILRAFPTRQLFRDNESQIKSVIKRGLSGPEQGVSLDENDPRIKELLQSKKIPRQKKTDPETAGLKLLLFRNRSIKAKIDSYFCDLELKVFPPTDSIEFMEACYKNQKLMDEVALNKSKRTGGMFDGDYEELDHKINVDEKEDNVESKKKKGLKVTALKEQNTLDMQGIANTMLSMEKYITDNRLRLEFATDKWMNSFVREGYLILHGGESLSKCGQYVVKKIGGTKKKKTIIPMKRLHPHYAHAIPGDPTRIVVGNMDRYGYDIYNASDRDEFDAMAFTLELEADMINRGMENCETTVIEGGNAKTYKGLEYYKKALAEVSYDGDFQLKHVIMSTAEQKINKWFGAESDEEGGDDEESDDELNEQLTQISNRTGDPSEHIKQSVVGKCDRCNGEHSTESCNSFKLPRDAVGMNDVSFKEFVNGDVVKKKRVMVTNGLYCRDIPVLSTGVKESHIPPFLKYIKLDLQKFYDPFYIPEYVRGAGDKPTTTRVFDSHVNWEEFLEQCNFKDVSLNLRDISVEGNNSVVIPVSDVASDVFILSFIVGKNTLNYLLKQLVNIECGFGLLVRRESIFYLKNMVYLQRMGVQIFDVVDAPQLSLTRRHLYGWIYRNPVPRLRKFDLTVIFSDAFLEQMNVHRVKMEPFFPPIENRDGDLSEQINEVQANIENEDSVDGDNDDMSALTCFTVLAEGDNIDPSVALIATEELRGIFKRKNVTDSDKKKKKINSYLLRKQGKKPSTYISKENTVLIDEIMKHLVILDEKCEGMDTEM